MSKFDALNRMVTESALECKWLFLTRRRASAIEFIIVTFQKGNSGQDENAIGLTEFALELTCPFFMHSINIFM